MRPLEMVLSSERDDVTSYSEGSTHIEVLSMKVRRETENSMRPYVCSVLNLVEFVCNICHEEDNS